MTVRRLGAAAGVAATLFALGALPSYGAPAGKGRSSEASASSLLNPVAAVTDFNGDGTTDISVFRPSEGGWYVQAQPPYPQVWGQSGDVPLPADYDGNGTTDIAVFRDGEWYVKDQPPYPQIWGQAGDVPVPGDYDGDGDADIAVFRDGHWYVKDQPPYPQIWGQAGDVPVPGDYDGDGATDIAVFRDGHWYVKDQPPYPLIWGQAGDIPVPGDYDGNGTTDIAVFRDGHWYVKDQPPYPQIWGQAEDIPVPGDYDGSGTSDIAVFRHSEGGWYVQGQPPFPQTWGTTCDVPLPLSHAISTLVPPDGPCAGTTEVSVAITSAPPNPTPSTDADFQLAIGGSPTFTECTESAGVGDRFGRSGVLGSADAGGEWLGTAWGGLSNFTTDGQQARVTAAASTTNLSALPVAPADSDVSARVTIDALPIGDAAGALLTTRVEQDDDLDVHAGARWVVRPGRQVELQIVALWSNGFDPVVESTVVGSNYEPGQVFWLRLQEVDSVIRAKTWVEGKAEPDWQLTATPPGPLPRVRGQAAGPTPVVGMGAWGGPGLSNAVQVITDDFSAIDPNVAAHVAPCSAGSASFSGLAFGGHVFRARVRAAPSEASAIYAWTIVPAAPAVALTSTPSNSTGDRSATFAWTASGVIDSTTCTLDGLTSACTSPTTYNDLSLGEHEFTVEVVNTGGSASATYSWTIEDDDLIPIAVRGIRPLSALAVFYNEANGVILDVKYFCEMPDGAAGGLPAGLVGWTTLDYGVTPDPLCSSWADFTVGARTGVVIATSVRPACGTGMPPAGAPCLEDAGYIGQQVNNFCRQANGTVQCWDATGVGSTQNVQMGAQFIRGYDSTTPTGTGPPQLRTAYLDSASPLGCGSYFNSVPSQCLTRMTVKLDLGNLVGTYPHPNPPPPTVTQALRASDVDVRFMLGRSDNSTQCNYGNNCALNPTNPNATGGGVTYQTAGSSSSPHLQIPAESLANGVGLQVRVRNATNHPNAFCRGSGFDPRCRYWWTGNGLVPENQADSAAELVAAPVQRSFSGSADRTGPLRWTRLTASTLCNGVPDLGFTETVEAASVPAGRTCFYMEMGLQGAIAVDQDEPPIAFNLGSTGSQRAFLDCDPNLPLGDEIVNGCGVSYAVHGFSINPLCPSSSSFFALPKTPPWDDWPPFTCVLTQVGSTANQALDGFEERMFGTTNPTCPLDGVGFVPGRNYWSDANNSDDTWTFPNLHPDDPRIVRLPVLPSSGFSGNGNETHPIASFDRFYITGWGRLSGGTVLPMDPCPGNMPPPGLAPAVVTPYFWGHVIP